MVLLPLGEHSFQPSSQRIDTVTFFCYVVKNVFFCDKIIIFHIMQSIDDKILARIRGKGRGYVFFSTDFTLLGESKSVLKAIERLVNMGDILRVARGIYCYPKIDKR